MLGKFCDINLATTATLSGGVWSTDLPLANMQEEARYILAPARCEHPAELIKSQFDVALSKARAVSMVALLFHTLSVGARYRLTIAEPGGSLAAPVYDTGWVRVFSRNFHSSDMAWEDPGFWLGQLSSEELALYPPHLWIPLPATLASQIRIELDDTLNGDGFIDIGGLYVAADFSPSINFERGRDLSLVSRDLVDEAPSGRNFTEGRTPRRQLAVTWSALTTPEAYRFFDAGARARTSGVVLFVPDTDSAPGRLREAFPATFEKPPAPRFTYERSNSVAATFKEILG